MANNLNPSEVRFLQQVSTHEEVSSISHLLSAIINGVTLAKEDLLSIEDYLMDREGDLNAQELDVPPFFDVIRTIVARLLSTPLTSLDQPSGFPGMQGIPGAQGYQQPLQQPKKARKPKQQLSNPQEPREPKVSKREKYKDAEITPDNVPQYLVDIHAIISQVVEARCQEEIERRILAESKLEKLQSVLKGM